MKTRRDPNPPPDEATSTLSFDGIESALRTVRAHLGMDVAFVTEFAGSDRRFRYVDAAGRAPFEVGSVLSLKEGYCARVADGRIPQLVPDTSCCPEAMSLPATRDLPIGSHMGVPLRLSSGKVYGTLCCFGHEADPSLGQRDLQLMRAVAALVAQKIEAELEERAEGVARVARIAAVLSSGQPDIVVQPVFGLRHMTVDGAEALARFSASPTRTPDLWFAEAGQAGLRTALELQAIRNAIHAYRRVWARGRLRLGINCSPQTLLDGGLEDILASCPPELIIIEITEHAQVQDYGALGRAMAPLRARGMRVAVDDAGSGYASMRHILDIAPDIIKLDTTLTRGIEDDAIRRAMVNALIGFGRETGCRIVAEGVETAAALSTLRAIGTDAGQGYHLGRPVPVDTFLGTLDLSRIGSDLAPA